jgi:hypothetical protein
MSSMRWNARPRYGAAVDDREGARYVVIGETALKTIIRELGIESAERPPAEYFGGFAR